MRPWICLHDWLRCLTTGKPPLPRGRLPFRAVTPALTYLPLRSQHHAAIPTRRKEPPRGGGWGTHHTPVLRVMVGTGISTRSSIRLRLSALALGPDSPRGRRTRPRNLWSSSGRGIPHPSPLLNVCILTPTKSTAVSTAASPSGTLSYPATMKIAPASSVVCLSPVTLSARNH